MFLGVVGVAATVTLTVMFRRPIEAMLRVLLICLVSLSAAGVCRAQTAGTGASGQTYTSISPDSDADYLYNYMKRRSGTALGDQYRLTSHYQPQTPQLTTFEYYLHGAAAGAKLGLFAAALGGVAGAWEEDTDLYIVGAAALAGALLNGTLGPRNARWSIGVSPSSP